MNDGRFVVVVGGANMDTAVRAGPPLRPGDSTPGRVRHAPGGVARNVAENLARLGHAVRLISVVGDDAAGHALLTATRHAGVDVSMSGALAGAATASYVAMLDAGGELVAAVNDMQVLDRLTPALLAPHAGQMAEAAALVLDANLPEATLGWLFEQRGAAPVFADAVSAHKCRRLLPWLGRVRLLKANRLEAQALSGLPAQTPAEVERAALKLHALGVRQVVVSLGAAGQYFSALGDASGGAAGDAHGDRHGTASGGAHRDAQDRESGWQAAPPADVHDTTGAGDALMAGLVHAHLRGEPLARAVRFGAGCAAMTVSVASANHPGLSVAQVERLLAASTPPPAEP